MPDLDQREREPERLHIDTSPVCNDNCVFCMEEDRTGRFREVARVSPDEVRRRLEVNAHRKEMCFTTGEPTLNPNLPQYVRWAKELGYTLIGVITNGRRLAYPHVTRELLEAGVNQFIVSIHGHNAKLHESHSRTPGSFQQSRNGLAMLAYFRGKYAFRVDTSTVVTDRNYQFFGEIYAFFKSMRVDQVVFNCMQTNGRADTFFELIYPRYAAVAAEYKAFLDALGEPDPRPQVFLVDIPPCVMQHVEPSRRGYVERYVHYESDETKYEQALQLKERELEGDGFRPVTRDDLNLARRVKREACGTCAYDSLCEGVWSRYVEAFGWDEFVPVAAAAGRTGAGAAAVAI